jgi:carbon monoxide dehydrogenase subunit G
VGVETTLEIAASPARVWMLLDNPDCLSQWMPNVVETQYPSGRPAHGGRGTVFRQIVDERGSPKSYDGEVVAFEAGRLLGVRLTDGTVIIEADYLVEPGGSGTLLTFKGDVRMRNPVMNMMMVAAWPMTRMLMLEQIKRLKAAAEALPALTPIAKAKAPVKAAKKVVAVAKPAAKRSAVGVAKSKPATAAKLRRSAAPKKPAKRK